MTVYHYYNLRRNADNSIDVLGFSTYPESSVLAGQTMKVFLDTFDSVEDAQTQYPLAVNFYNKWTGAVNTFNHLPGEDDPVAGGMSPDDLSDGPEAEQPADPMTAVQIAVLAELRHAGYAVITWTPEELRDANPRRVEDRSIELGWEIINDLASDSYDDSIPWNTPGY